MAVPHVTVVVVTWNAADLLARCLAALEAQTLDRAAYELVVVDNASVDGTVEMLRADFPAVTVLHQATNTGFAGGCAAALEEVNTAWVVLVNNDAVAEPGFLESLMAQTRSPGAADVGAWTARVLLAEPDGQGRTLVNSTGVVVHRDGNGADRDWLSPVDDLHPSPEVFGFCGAAALLRMAAVQEAGGFDPGYFLYYEDTDLSWRLRLAGWQIRYCHDAVAHHEHAASSDVLSESFRFYNERNRLITLAKNAPLHLVAAVVVRHPLMSALRLAGGTTQRRIARVRFRAYADFLRRLPTAIRQRRSMPSSMRARRREVAKLLVSGRSGGLSGRAGSS